MKKWRGAAAAAGTVLILAGLLGMAYPFVGNYINSRTHRRVVTDYQEEADSLSDENLSRMLREAEEYNEWIFSRGETLTSLSEEELEAYGGMLQVSVTGIMGYIDIPKIHVTLPIYHGTREEVLQVGIGHLAGSSLPVGGENTHAVLTGHSGLPSAKLFTDLDQLEPGDTFTVTVLEHPATYRVESTEVVEPEEAEHMTIEEGKDLCTLVTCTPIGVNSHRLLVHGLRAPDAETEASPAADGTEMTRAQAEAREGDGQHGWLLACLVLAVALAVGLSIRRKRRRDARKKDSGTRKEDHYED